MSKLKFDRLSMSDVFCQKDGSKIHSDDNGKDSSLIEFTINKRQLEDYAEILMAKDHEIHQLNARLKLYETNFAECLRKIDTLSIENENLKCKFNDDLGADTENENGQMINGQDMDQSTIAEFKSEYLILRKHLEELKDIYESADVEAEAKITLLANRIEDLEEILDEKNRECMTLRNDLHEQIQNLEQAENKAQNFAARFSQQKDMTENLRDELEKATTKHKELAKEKNDLLIMNASLNHELNFYKKKSRSDEHHILNQVIRAGKELQECIDNLRILENYEKAKEASLTNSVANLAWKIDALEKGVNNKYKAIDCVENRLHLIRSALMKKYGL